MHTSVPPTLKIIEHFYHPRKFPCPPSQSFQSNEKAEVLQGESLVSYFLSLHSGLENLSTATASANNCTRAAA